MPATPPALLPEKPDPVPLELPLFDSLLAPVDPMPEAPLVDTAGRDVKEPVAVGDASIVTRTVDWTSVSVVTKVFLTEAGQLVTVDGHAINVDVRVVRTVEVVTLGYDSPAEPFGCEPALGVGVETATGHTVVETRIVSVVTYVLFCLAGQSTTLDGHAVMVEVRVLKTVDVMNSPAGDPPLV